MGYSVDGLSLLVELLRASVPPEVWVMTRIPDHLPQYLPLVVLRRTGGDSPSPRFWDQHLVNVQCWAAGDPASGVDGPRAAEELAETVRGVLWTAWETQTVTSHGHIARLRESSAPRDLGDPDLSLVGRCIATYDLRLRRRPVA